MDILITALVTFNVLANVTVIGLLLNIEHRITILETYAEGSND